MSWLFSRALVAAYSEASCSAGGQSAPSNATPTPQAYCAPDRMTDFSRPSRFGMTFAPLTANHGEALLTWFLEGFPARIFPLLAVVPVSVASGPGSGKSLRGSFAKFDRATSSWKTRQLSLLGGSIPFSGTWPRWGTMRNGECWERQTWERRTKGTGSGLLPTPLSTCGTHGGPNQRDSSGRPGLQMAAMMWPTPNVPNGGRRVPDNAKINGGNTPTAYLNGKKMQVGLEQAVKWWPTPTKSDGCGGPGCSGREGGENLRTAAGGQLNPTWVEWLMGWPLGWTDLQPLATDRCQPVRLKHGVG